MLPMKCIYVHCRNGKNRSAYTVYALLRLAFRIPEALAREALANRVDRNGFPLANLDAHCEVVHAWLENELACLGSKGDEELTDCDLLGY